MKQEPDFYLYFDRDNGEGYELGAVVNFVDRDIETLQVWADYEITEVDGEPNLGFKDTLTEKELVRLEKEVLQAMWEDSEADRVAVAIANLEASDEIY